MYWQYPSTSSPHWAYSVAASIPSCKENFMPAAPLLPVPVSNGKYGLLGCEDFSEIFEDDSQVKRPMNSFLLWAKIMRKKFAKDYPNLHNAEISKLLGKVWNSMTTSEKRPFVEKAEKLRVLHMRDHPNYRYSPKKKKEKRAAQRMIPPEVAAAFHNAIFDLKSIKTTVQPNFQGRLPDDLGEECQENHQFTKPFTNDNDSAYQRMKIYEQNLEKFHDYPSTPYYYDNAFGSLVNRAHSCNAQHQERTSPTLTVKARSDTTGQFAGRCDTRSRQQLNDNGKTCRYGDELRNGSPISKIVLPRDMIQDSLDQVTPSSPEENLAYGITNEENFYPAVETKEHTSMNNLKLQDLDALSSCDNESMTGSSPEHCYDDEVPPFLRVLLDKPIHLNEPKCQQFQEKEDEIIFHDLGEIISKELGMERKACLYS